jgi:carbamoyl-phosphate synthase large subunit
LKLLITSIGSMVGQGIMDVLDYPGVSRRALVEVVGTNSIADSPSNFRADRCYLVPETASAEYASRLGKILRAESPGLILCGRDEDTLAVSRLKATEPDLPGVLPCANPEAALIGYDKWQTALFAGRHGLPFAESFRPGESGGEAELLAFAERVGYPLVAKPVRGSASRGVFFVRGPAEARMTAQLPGVVLQEYLGEPAVLEPYFASLAGPPPLFGQAGEADQHSCHTVIAPDGRVGAVAVICNHHEYSQIVRTRRIADSALEALTLSFAERLAAEGAGGPLNVEARRDRRGGWKAQEINLRNTGSTPALFLLGFDELGMIVRAFVPEASFPEMRPDQQAPIDQVDRRNYAYPMSDVAMARLKREGVWERG